jgi:Flp pilus assembly protein TadG
MRPDTPLPVAPSIPTPGPRRAAPVRRERGAALVEFSLILMFLLLLGFGIYEFGFAWRSSAGTTSAARSAARTASSLGVDRQADYQALSSLKADLQSSGLMGDVQLVVIYKVITANGAVPTACTTNTATAAVCNIYTAADLAGLDSSDFDASTGCLISGTVKNYCPSTRNPIMASADYLGVWVKVRHGYHTKLFGSGIDIKRSAVMRIEPRVG